MGQQFQSRLDLLYPDMSRKVQTQQLRQKLDHDNSKPLRTFGVGDLVFARDFTLNPPKWTPGRILKGTGPLSYQVELNSGAVVRKHVDQLRSRTNAEADSTIPAEPAVDPLTLPDIHSETVPPPSLPPPPQAPRPRKSWHLRPRKTLPNYRF